MPPLNPFQARIHLDQTQLSRDTDETALVDVPVITVSQEPPEAEPLQQQPLATAPAPHVESPTPLGRVDRVAENASAFRKRSRSRPSTSQQDGLQPAVKKIKRQSLRSSASNVNKPTTHPAKDWWRNFREKSGWTKIRFSFEPTSFNKDLQQFRDAVKPSDAFDDRAKEDLRIFLQNWFNMLTKSANNRLEWDPNYFDALVESARDAEIEAVRYAPSHSAMYLTFASEGYRALDEDDLNPFSWRPMSFDEIPLQSDFFQNICQAANQALTRSQNLWDDSIAESLKTRWAHAIGVGTGTSDFAAYAHPATSKSGTAEDGALQTAQAPIHMPGVVTSTPSSGDQASTSALSSGLATCSSAERPSPSLPPAKNCKAIIEYKPFLTLRDLLVILFMFMKSRNRLNLDIPDGTSTPAFDEERNFKSKLKPISSGIKWILLQVVQQMHKNGVRHALLASHEAAIQLVLCAEEIQVSGLILRDPSIWPDIRAQFALIVRDAVYPEPSDRPGSHEWESAWLSALQSSSNPPSLLESVLAMTTYRSSAVDMLEDRKIKWVGQPIKVPEDTSQSTKPSPGGPATDASGAQSRGLSHQTQSSPSTLNRQALANLGVALDADMPVDFPLSFFRPWIGGSPDLGSSMDRLRKHHQSWKFVSALHTAEQRSKSSTESDKTLISLVSTEGSTLVDSPSSSPNEPGVPLALQGLPADLIPHLKLPQDLRTGKEALADVASAIGPVEKLPQLQERTALDDHATPVPLMSTTSHVNGLPKPAQLHQQTAPYLHATYMPSVPMKIEATAHLGSGRLYDAYKADVWFPAATRPLWVVLKFCDLASFPTVAPLPDDEADDSVYTMYSRSEAIQHIWQEIAVLTGPLKGEQGRAVPRLHGLWLLDDGKQKIEVTEGGSAKGVSSEAERVLGNASLVVVIQEYGGRGLDEYAPGFLTSGHLDKALQSLERLHACDILHNDIQARHLLLHPEKDCLMWCDLEAAGHPEMQTVLEAERNAQSEQLRQRERDRVKAMFPAHC